MAESGVGMSAAGAEAAGSTSDTATDVADVSQAESAPGPAKRRRLLYVTLPGCWGALIFSCLSFTPSLLPRTGVIQGLLLGITAAIGYGLAVMLASIWRAFADRDARPARRRSWLVFFIAGGVLLVVMFGLGQYWQYLLPERMGSPD